MNDPVLQFYLETAKALLQSKQPVQQVMTEEVTDRLAAQSNVGKLFREFKGQHEADITDKEYQAIQSAIGNTKDVFDNTAKDLMAQVAQRIQLDKLRAAHAAATGFRAAVVSQSQSSDASYEVVKAADILRAWQEALPPTNPLAYSLDLSLAFHRSGMADYLQRHVLGAQ
jgi:hypothetical protein